MELNKFGILCILGILVILGIVGAAQRTSYVDNYYSLHSLYNISNITGVAFLNITLGYIGVSQIATLSDLTAGNITVTSVIEVRNDEAVTLSAGDPVYFTSYISGLSLQGVKFANNTDITKHSDCIILDTISVNQRGQCVVEGHVTGMDTSGHSFGDELYLDYGGNMTSTKPTDAICIQKIAQVLRAHASLGVIWVSGAGRCNDVPARFNVPGDINTSAGFYQAGNKVNDSLYDLSQFNDDVGFYSSIGDLPTAAVTDGATTTISTGDQIYDFVIALNYITNAVSDLVNYFTKTQVTVHIENNITSLDTSMTIYIDNKADVDFLNRNMGWTNLTRYPSACTAGSYITTLSDSVTCVTPTCSDITNCVVGAITSIVLDTSPELGGYLDANGKDIGSKTDEIENIYMGTMNNISFGDGQEAKIWYNGSSLVIKVT